MVAECPSCGVLVVCFPPDGATARVCDKCGFLVPLSPTRLLFSEELWWEALTVYPGETFVAPRCALVKSVRWDDTPEKRTTIIGRFWSQLWREEREAVWDAIG